jgi:hypothetical protein
MERKKRIGAFLVVLALSANAGIYSQALGIDLALAQAAEDIVAKVPQGTKIAIINITSDSMALSDYIITELNANLITTGVLRVVPRSTVELQAVNREFNFQMSGYVSDDDQKRLGQFLEADSIVTGTVTRLSGENYRLVINAIELESFTYQTSFRSNLQYNSQLRGLIANSGRGSGQYEDYTTGERVVTAALNTFFGIGSLLQHDKLGRITLLGEVMGITFLAVGAVVFPDYNDEDYYDDKNTIGPIFMIAGGLTIGASILFGYIIPFFHHKPGTQVSRVDYRPLRIEPVLTNSTGINGIRIVYGLRF